MIPSTASIVIVGFIGTIGCAGRRSAASVAFAQDVSYMVRTATPVADADYHAAPSEDATSALAIPPLREVALPEGARELRISDWYPMVAGTPAPVIRLVEQAGHRPIGQVILVWMERREWYRHPTTRCTRWTNNMRTCVLVKSEGALDWTVVAGRFADLGAWTMTAPCEADRVHRTDSGMLLIRRLAGAQFSAYDCNAPGSRQGTEAGRAALALYQYFQTIVRQSGSPQG